MGSLLRPADSWLIETRLIFSPACRLIPLNNLIHVSHGLQNYKRSRKRRKRQRRVYYTNSKPFDLSSYFKSIQANGNPWCFHFFFLVFLTFLIPASYSLPTLNHLAPTERGLNSATYSALMQQLGFLSFVSKRTTVLLHFHLNAMKILAPLTSRVKRRAETCPTNSWTSHARNAHVEKKKPRLANIEDCIISGFRSSWCGDGTTEPDREM